MKGVRSLSAGRRGSSNRKLSKPKKNRSSRKVSAEYSPLGTGYKPPSKVHETVVDTMRQEKERVNNAYSTEKQKRIKLQQVAEQAHVDMGRLDSENLSLGQ